MSGLAVEVPEFKKLIFSSLDQNALSLSVLMTFAQSIEAVCSQVEVFGLREIGLNVIERAKSDFIQLDAAIPMIQKLYYQDIDRSKVKACHKLTISGEKNLTPLSEFVPFEIFNALKRLAPLARSQVSSEAYKHFSPMYKTDIEGKQNIFAALSISVASLCIRIVYERKGKEKSKEFNWMNEFAAAVCTEFLILSCLVDQHGWPE